MQNYKIKVQRLLVSVLNFDFCDLRLGKRPAFTLIELLITIVIIAILSGIGLASFAGAQKTSRDGKRKADLETIRSALEIYRSDIGAYPGGTGSLSPDYITTVPTDPTAGYLYAYTLTGTTYTLCAALERTTAAVAGCGSCGSGTCSYKVTNP